MPDHTRTARGVVAALAAVAALVLAGNAGPAESAERPPGGGTGRMTDIGRSLASADRPDGSVPTPPSAPR
ncbi:hypothetical protein [Streptomyces sp. SID5910]|uniref:hypothetical protein n=1 Tax=Streptomyces sp. SID5910 TaxID=2690312 RepID=UPI0013AAF635|nr:hypothetical protein [Streptomyces sp. SID5910]MYR45334.1 hypothetical protein [Streptomyces sp. SID5910]